MRLIRDLHGIPDALKGAAVAIGNFDGLHAGHRAVIAQVLRHAKEEKTPAAVMTFEPHPRMFFRKSAAPLRLEPFHAKARRLRALGVDCLFVLRFNAALAATDAETFIRDILIGALRARHVVTGENFVFGHKRGGDSALLRRFSQDGRFLFTAMPPVTVAEGVCSSTKIREHLAAGTPEHAASLLGRPYEMTGRVVHGDQRGGALGFSTANIEPGPVFAPAYGIYAVRFAIADPLDYNATPVWHGGAASWGIRPMFQLPAPLLEVHGFEPQPPLYGKRLRVQFLRYLRPEMYFPDTAALKRQMTKDCEAAKQFLQTYER